MRQKTSEAYVAMQRSGRPPRLRTIYALAGCAAFMAVALLFNTCHDFSHPLSNWMTEAQRWYDNLLGSVMWGSACVACLYYANYRRRLLRLRLVASPRPWHHRHEVRALLLLFAIVQLIQLPLAVWRTAVALQDPNTPAVANNLFSLFPVTGVLSPVIGASLIYYDRRRATRERRLLDNLCLACGYDLRASLECCPECGATRGHDAPAAA